MRRWLRSSTWAFPSRPLSACGALAGHPCHPVDTDAGSPDNPPPLVGLTAQAYSVDMNGVRTPFGPPFDADLDAYSGCLSTLPAPAQDWSLYLTVSAVFDEYGDPLEWTASPQTVTVNLRCEAGAVTTLAPVLTLVAERRQPLAHLRSGRRHRVASERCSRTGRERPLRRRGARRGAAVTSQELLTLNCSD